MLQRLPEAIENQIWKMKHEMELLEVLDHLLFPDWAMREIELSFQAHARDGLILVQQLSGGRVGQHITILSRVPGEQSQEIGQHWPTYNRIQMQRLQNLEILGEDKVWADEDWSKHYGTWKKDLGNGYSMIRLMIMDLPQLREFAAFEQQTVHEQFEYFPDFMPIEVMVPSNCVGSMVIPLDQHQLAVKYNFEDDMIFARNKVNEIEHATTSMERKKAVTDLIEFLIIKPTMLLHSPKLRTSIYRKMDEFMEWTTTCNDIKYAHYIHDMVLRMSTVLSSLVQDPLYTV